MAEHSTISIIYKTQSKQRCGGTLRESIDAVRDQATRSRFAVEIIGLADDPGVLAELRGMPGIDQARDAPEPLTPARNLGVEAATGDYVAFLDDDAIPAPGWLDHVTGMLRDGWDAVGGPLIPDWRDDEPGWLPESYHWLIGCGPYHDAEQTVHNTYGSNLVVDRSAFLDVGGFDESIGLGSGSAATQGGETRLCSDLRAAGYDAVRYHPRAAVQHVIEPGDVDALALLQRCYDQGRSKAVVGLSDREKNFVTNELLGGVGSPVETLSSIVLTGVVGAGYCRQRLLSTR